MGDVKRASGPSIPPRRDRKPLAGVFLLSLGLHAALILVLGSMVIFTYLKKAPVQFKSPPPQVVQRIEPRKLEYKVRMQESQKKSGRPSVSPRLTAQGIGSISLPEVKMQIQKTTPNKNLSNLSSFGGNGLGDGLGGGSGSGGLGLGVSAVNFFGIPDHGERIAFLVDVSLSMIEDEKGGVGGFRAVKEEIIKMVKRLSQATFFNVYMFGTGVDSFQPKFVLANDENKEGFEKWVEPYLKEIPENWSGVNFGEWSGNLSNNYTPPKDDELISNGGGSTRMDMALAAAFEQGADTVFILSDGTPKIKRPYTEKEQEMYGKIQKEFEDEKSQIRKDYERRRKKMEEDRKKLNEKRAKKGIAPKIVEVEALGVYPTPFYTDELILKHIKELGKKYYLDQKRKPPRIHCVGYLCEQPDEQFLRALSRENLGRFRRIHALVRPIKD